MIINLCYTNAWVLGLLNKEDREKWLAKAQAEGAEEADGELSQIFEDLDHVSLDEDECLPYDMWTLSKIEDGICTLYPWVANSESTMLQEDYIGPVLDPVEVKVNSPYGINESRAWVCKGYPIQIEKSELLRLQPYLNFMHYVAA